MSHKKITDLQLVKDEIGYGLLIKFDIIDKDVIKHITIPFARLHVNADNIKVSRKNEYFNLCDGSITSFHTVDIGFGRMHVLRKPFIKPDGYTEMVDYLEEVEYKTKEMTMEELEKALGHKVKIVKDKEAT